MTHTWALFYGPKSEQGGVTQHKANSPETSGALDHRILQYFTKTGNPAHDQVEYMKRECVRLKMNHLVAQPTDPIFLMGDLQDGGLNLAMVE